MNGNGIIFVFILYMIIHATFFNLYIRLMGIESGLHQHKKYMNIIP